MLQNLVISGLQSLKLTEQESGILRDIYNGDVESKRDQSDVTGKTTTENVLTNINSS